MYMKEIFKALGIFNVFFHTSLFWRCLKLNYGGKPCTSVLATMSCTLQLSVVPFQGSLHR